MKESGGERRGEATKRELWRVFFCKWNNVGILMFMLDKEFLYVSALSVESLINIIKSCVNLYGNGQH